MRPFLFLAAATTVCAVAPLAAVFVQNKLTIGDSVYAIGTFNGFPATAPTSNNAGKSNFCAFLAPYVGETCPMCYKPVQASPKAYGPNTESFRRTPGVSVRMGVNNVYVCAWCVMAGVSSAALDFAGAPDQSKTEWEMNGNGGRYANNAIVAFATLPAGKVSCPCQDPAVNDAANNQGKTCFNYYTDDFNSIGRVAQGFASGPTAARPSFTLAAVWVPNDSVCEKTTAEVPFLFASPAKKWIYNFARDATKTDVVAITTTEGLRCVATPCSDRTNACRSPAGGPVTDDCCKKRPASNEVHPYYANLVPFSNGCRVSSAGDVCVPDCGGAAGWQSFYPQATFSANQFDAAAGLKNFVSPNDVTPQALKLGGYLKNAASTGTFNWSNEYWACLFAPFFRERGCFPADVLAVGSKCVASQLTNSAVLFDNAPVDDQGKYVDTGITYIA